LPPKEKRYLAALSDDPLAMASVLANVAHFWVRRAGRELIRNMTEEEVRKEIAEEKEQDR
jgi:hypothetical protein